MENKRLWMNMGKTKLLVSDANLDVVKEAGKWLCE